MNKFLLKLLLSLIILLGSCSPSFAQNMVGGDGDNMVGLWILEDASDAVRTNPDGLDLGTAANPVGDIYAGSLTISGITLSGDLDMAANDILHTDSIFGSTAILPVRIGDAGTTGHSLASEDDLLVTGKLEIDGSTYHDGNIYMNGTGIYDVQAITVNSASLIGAAGKSAIQFEGVTQTPDAIVLAVPSTSNNFIVMEYGDIASDIAIPLSTNPQVNIVSADKTGYLSMGHNGTNSYLESSKGDIQFNSSILVGTTEYSADAGAVIGWNMPVSSTPTAGDEMSLTFDIDQTDLFTVYAEADSSGGIQNTAIKALTNMVIGSASAGVDYTLTFDGESDDGVITYQEDENNFDLGDTGLSTTGPINQSAGSLILPNGTTLPATCTVGSLFQDTDSDDCADTGSGDGALCICKSTDTWALINNF